MKSQPKVSVLMTSYNHERYIREQLDSILAQTWENWDLTVSDNGSTDGSLGILQDYEDRYPGRVRVVHGPGRACDNHFVVAAWADPMSDYYAWCDSDDVWLPDKLAMSVGALEAFGQDEPALYGSRLIMVDEAGKELGLYPLMNRVPPSFANAMVQCITGTPTMLFNRPARELIVLGAGREFYPDWWAYLIVSGVGGHVIYDPRPTVRYRQHGRNELGANRGLKAKVFRARAILDGKYHEWMGFNLGMLDENRDRLTPANRDLLAGMESLHRGEGSLFRRLMTVRDCGFRRQSSLQTVCLYAMAAMKLL